jgi:hypothetical protein
MRSPNEKNASASLTTPPANKPARINLASASTAPGE